MQSLFPAQAHAAQVAALRAPVTLASATITLIDYARPLKARAEARKRTGPYQWKPAQPGTERGFYQSRHGLACDARGSSFDLRLEDANEHLRGSRLASTTGYYADLDCSGDTLRPIVARLPKGRGFIAGWTMGEGMCASLDSAVWEDAAEAARFAHDMAERDAEAEQARQYEDQESEALDDDGADLDDEEA